MARQTLPRGDLLSLVGAGAAARTPQAEPEPQTESAPIRREEPTDATRPKRVAKRAIAPKGKGAPAPENETPSAPALSQPARKEKFNCRLTPDLADAVRDCVVALSGPPERLTIDSFAAEAFRREVERLKKAHNGGKDFPRRDYAPKPGRPIKR